MTPEQALALENRFVELKNEGKSVEEIAGILGVGKELVEAWDLAFEEAIKNSQKIDSLPLKMFPKSLNFSLRGVDGKFKGLFGKIQIFFDIILEKTPNQYYSSEEQDFDFSIKQFVIEDFQDIHHIHIKDIPVDTQWIFLTGENGYGKTTLLQALTIGLFGESDENKDLLNLYKPIPECSKIGIEYKNKKESQINNLLGSSFKRLQSVAVYGASRLQIQAKESQNDIADKSTTTYSLFNNDGILLNIELEMLFLKLEQNPRFEKIKQVFLNLVPDLHDIIVENREVFYIEKDTEGNTYEKMPFEKLASGYRSILAMMGDMMIRLYKEHPNETDPKDLAGIVIIDELDLHLHPKWQRELPMLLSNAFPKIQFIASTHSVIPFLGAPKNSVFIKVNRSRETGITAQKLDIDVTNLSPNLILTSPIFGMETIRSINSESVHDVRLEDTFDELEKNNKLQEYWDNFEASDEDFPDDLFEEAQKGKG